MPIGPHCDNGRHRNLIKRPDWLIYPFRWTWSESVGLRKDRYISSFIRFRSSKWNTLERKQTTTLVNESRTKENKRRRLMVVGWMHNVCQRVNKNIALHRGLIGTRSLLARVSSRFPLISTRRARKVIYHFGSIGEIRGSVLFSGIVRRRWRPLVTIK